MKRYLSQQNNPHRRGTAMVMVILISVIITGLVLTIAWAAAVQAQISGGNIRLDQANIAAESAGQWAVWQFKNSNTWRQTTIPSTLPTMTIGNNIYSYALTCVDAGSTATLYWPFSEGTGYTTADASGNNNTGQLMGGVTWTTAGRYGDALVFDGSTGYVDAGNNPSTNIVSSVTMAAWVKMYTAQQDQKVGGNQDGISGGYKMSIYGLKEEFEVRDANNNPNLNRSVGGGTILTMGIWYHVAGVYNTSTNSIKTYVNGVLDRELDGVESNALTTTTGDFIMGKEPWITGGSTRYFDGVIDDVRVYNRALSDQEIKMLANTSVHIHSVATLKNSSAIVPSGTYDFICSAPTPAAPIAPALTVGGNLPMKLSTVSGNVQVTGNVTGMSTSAVNGTLTYAGTYSDTHNYITITNAGKTITATKNTTVAAPTIPYATIQAQAISTVAGGSNQTFTFGYLANQVNVIYVTGNVTNPTIDTSQSAGTVLIQGNLTLTKACTFGSAGFPAYIVVEGNVTQSSGSTLNLTGALYVGGSWTHVDSTIYGDTCVNGSVTDNSTTGSTFIVGSIPWFDPRVNTPAVPIPMFYTDYEGVTP